MGDGVAVRKRKESKLMLGFLISESDWIMVLDMTGNSEEATG